MHPRRIVTMERYEEVYGRSFGIRHEKLLEAPPGGEIKMTSYPACNKTSFSAETCKLFVPKTSTSYESRSFAVHGPNSSNSLPAELRLTDTLTTFRRKLKTHLFGL